MIWIIDDDSTYAGLLCQRIAGQGLVVSAGRLLPTTVGPTDVYLVDLGCLRDLSQAGLMEIDSARLLVMTGLNMRMAQRIGARIGASRVMQKPLDLAILIPLLRELVSR